MAEDLEGVVRDDQGRRRYEVTIKVPLTHVAGPEPRWAEVCSTVVAMVAHQELHVHVTQPGRRFAGSRAHTGQPVVTEIPPEATRELFPNVAPEG